MDKEALIERKKIDNGYEIRISTIERYIEDEDGTAEYSNHKEILFLYITDSFDRISHKLGKDYDENLAGMLLQNKYIIDAIDRVYSAPDSTHSTHGEAVIYHTDIYCLVNNIFNNVKKGE